jgi:Family of unknown function (DUF5989)
MLKKSHLAKRAIAAKPIKLKDNSNAAAHDNLRDRANARPVGFLGELAYMIRQNKKWWLLPILLVLVVLGAVIFLGGTAAAPFVYTLF